MTHFFVLCIILSTHSLLTKSYILPTNEEFINPDNKLNWNSAESHCLSTYNSHLLSIHDSQTFQQLRTTIIATNQYINHFWIGLVNIASTNKHINYTWSDSTPFDFGTDLTSFTYPWFDERPESPYTDRYVRLWGGSASLLWDDTNGENKYFWICNDAEDDVYTENNVNQNVSDINDHEEESIEPMQPTQSINNNNNNNNNSYLYITTLATQTSNTAANTSDFAPGFVPQTNSTNYNAANNMSLGSKSDLDTFWKFALIAILVLSSCILLLRVRTMYKNYKSKRSMSSSGSILGPTQITDISFIESSNINHKFRTVNIPTLHFSSVEQRDDTLEIEQSVDPGRLISPFSHSHSPDLPDFGVAHPTSVIQNKKNAPSLSIEHDINTIDSIEGIELENDCDMISNAATFDGNTMRIDEEDIMDAERRSILLIMDKVAQEDEDTHSTTFNDDTMSSKEHLTKGLSFVEHNRTSFNSTMVAFDVRSFKLKAEEFKCINDEINGEFEYIGVNNGSKHVGPNEFVLSGETSDDCDSETNINPTYTPTTVPDLMIMRFNASGSLLSDKEIEIKANISQIMQNLKRMQKMSGNSEDNNNKSMFLE